MQIVFCVLFDIYCVGFAVVRLRISCCLWYDVMHIFYVSYEAFDVLRLLVLG